MMNSSRWALLCTTLLLAGCWTQSVHPIYSDDTLVFEQALLGSFGDPDGEAVSFTRDGADSYKATFRDADGGNVTFEARLARIADRLFLDLYADQWHGEHAGPYRRRSRGRPWQTGNP